MLRPTMSRYVALACCDRLVGLRDISISISTRKTELFIFLVLMLMSNVLLVKTTNNWVRSYVSAYYYAYVAAVFICAYAYAYALVKTSLY